MKSIEDIIAVLLSGSILLFSFFYIVNFQAKLFSDLFENKKKDRRIRKRTSKTWRRTCSNWFICFSSSF